MLRDFYGFGLKSLCKNVVSSEFGPLDKDSLLRPRDSRRELVTSCMSVVLRRRNSVTVGDGLQLFRYTFY